jgi:hypothetical protein
MDGTIDVHGLKFHWQLERDDARTCTLTIAFGDLTASHRCNAGLTKEQIEEQARLLASSTISATAPTTTADNRLGTN